MRSEVVFVMHPSDEAEFVNLFIAEPGTVLVNGPTWSSPRPPIKTDIQSCGNYAMIWNPSETPALAGRHLRKENAEWWYCENEFLTIQFLRSGFQFGEPFLFEGRIALATTDKGGGEFHGPSAHAIEERFKRLRKFIKKNYANGVIIWQNTSLPRSKTNPLKAAVNVWVGPHAIGWLREAPESRWVQQFRGAGGRGYIVDRVN